MFDDIAYIQGNDNIRDIHNIPMIWKAWNHPSRFVGFFTFALNYHFHKLDVLGYHLVNVLIHLMNACLVWMMVLLLFKMPRLKDDRLFPQRYLIAWITTLLFVTHPIQTEAVSYVSQRFSSLATLFYLLSVYFYGRGRISDKKNFSLYMLSGVSALLGMFTKQITITIPLTIFLFEMLFLRKREDPIRINARLLVYIFLFLLIVPSIFSFNVQNILSIKHESGSYLGDNLTNVSYLLTQFRVLFTYIKLIFFPIGQNLLYEFPASYSLFEPKTFICFIGLIGIFLGGVRCLKTNILMAFGIFWFFITLSVESTIIVIKHVIFEHRMYLPSFGFFLFCAVALVEIFRSAKKCCVAVCVIGLTFSYLTLKRNVVWSDEMLMWGDVIQKSPRESRGYMNMGLVYFDRADWNMALKYLDQAIACNPKNHAAYSNRGMVQMALGYPEKALADYNQALMINGRYVEAYINRGNYYSFLNDYKKAIADYNEALRTSPSSVQALLNRGNKYFKLKEFDAAIKDYSRSIELSPSFVQGYAHRADVYTYIKKFDLALADYNRAIKLDDKDAETVYRRGNLYVKKGDLQSALNDYNKALEINPEHPKAKEQINKLTPVLNNIVDLN
ncbi:MAG: tetratricopeptide repeat protein [Candidatus Omnitrophica bacterium]|nr:tetratricopeptide repeat protein [Candidatus Omnitrophota bacterium]